MCDARNSPLRSTTMMVVAVAVAAVVVVVVAAVVVAAVVVGVALGLEPPPHLGCFSLEEEGIRS